jgi:hypothetical protein
MRHGIARTPLATADVLLDEGLHLLVGRQIAFCHGTKLTPVDTSCIYNYDPPD